MARARIGTSGFSYKHWKGVFYPDKLPQRKWLEFFCEHFDTLELNNSFYRLPERSAFERWAAATPEDFTFAVKVSRYITHIRRLKDPDEPVHRMVERAEGLGHKLGPLLFQLPPNFGKDLDRLRRLLDLRRPGMRWVFEFRNREWFDDDVLGALCDEGSALCVHDALEDCPVAATADFAYLRLHGSKAHQGDYSRKELERWASVARGWLDDGIDAYVYFNNDAYGYAVKNAKKLIELTSTSLAAAGSGRGRRGG